MKDNNINIEKLIIGDSKIQMSDSDFVELCTRLGNDIDNCPFDEGYNCVKGCANCWAKFLKGFIEV